MFCRFPALNWSWLFSKYLSLKMMFLSSSPVNYSGFFWLHWFLRRHTYFASWLTLLFLISCSFPSSRYSFTAIKVSSESWLSQRCFSNSTNSNCCLSLSTNSTHPSSLLWVCACVSSSNISFGITCFVFADF